MADKKAEKKPKPQKQGRPKMLPAELSERFNVRASCSELETWKEHASNLGVGSLGGWLRMVANRAVMQSVK